MISRYVISTLMLTLLCSSTGISQLRYADEAIEISPLRGPLYEIICSDNFSVNVILSDGPDGLLLVDSGYETVVDTLKAALDDRGKLKYIILTHPHGDHAGGAGKLGSEAVIVAHENAAARLTTRYYSLPPLDNDLKVDRTFTGEMTLTFNGEQIKLVEVAPGHTDADILVYFTESQVVHLGDLAFPDHFPYSDLGLKGNAVSYIDNLDKIISMFPDEVIFISGHGRRYSREDLRQYHQDLTTMLQQVRKEIEAGLDLQAILDKKLFDDRASWATSFITADAWITAVYYSINPVETKPSICEPVTRVLEMDGIDKAVHHYRELKQDKTDQYDFTEAQLNLLGYQLLARQRISDALRIFELNIESYPNAWNVYDSYAEALLLNNQREEAIRYYKKSLEINPDNSNAVTVLKNLEANDD